MKLEEELREVSPKQAENMFLWQQLKLYSGAAAFAVGVYFGVDGVIDHFTSGNFNNFADCYRYIWIGSTSLFGDYVFIDFSRYLKKFKESNPSEYFRILHRVKIKE